MQKQLVFGIHAVESLLSHHPERIVTLHVLEGRKDVKIEKIVKLAKTANLTIQFASRHELDKLTKNGTHQGVIAVCQALKNYDESDILPLLERLNGNAEKTTPPFILILDQVQDPHNLGAVWRTADAAGVTMIIVPKDKSAGLSPVVYKIASGASETVPLIQVTNLSRTMEMLKENGIWLYGTDMSAPSSLFNVKFEGPLAIVLGAEGAGLRRLTRETCDYLIKIPMIGTIESLNVSVATGICLFEVVRQRLQVK